MPAKLDPPHAEDKPALSGPPSRRTLLALVLTMLVAHALALLSVSGSPDLRLPDEDATRTGPLQTRWVPPPASTAPTPPAQKIAPPRTRLATEPTPIPIASHAHTPEPEPEPEPAKLPQQAMKATGPEPAPSTESPPTEHAPVDAIETAPHTQTASVMPSAVANETPTATAAMPLIPLGALPPSTLLNYRLTGSSKGRGYHASGELRWQANESAYAMSLSVRAFLLGSRHWRSVGIIDASGLAPTRFSDSWRSERATHFDRKNKRLVFSNNAPVAELEPGAQDQISLYVQLAAAMAGEPQRFQPGTRLQIQTATTRDALPWLLTMVPAETLSLADQTLVTAKWVCQPRNRFDATVEFWVAEKYNWMPVRIRITQVNGDFIDLMLSGQEPLPPLPVTALQPQKTTPS